MARRVALARPGDQGTRPIARHECRPIRAELGPEQRIRDVGRRRAADNGALARVSRRPRPYIHRRRRRLSRRPRRRRAPLDTGLQRSRLSDRRPLAAHRLSATAQAFVHGCALTIGYPGEALAAPTMTSGRSDLQSAAPTAADVPLKARASALVNPASGLANDYLNL